ncbi:MAG TPA: response regulator [Candidatus Wallbacteria bacterium]|nr:response regulator [Candidatus Wallbacteria bacterium]
MNKKILVIDDSEFIRLSLKLMLEEIGFEIVEAESGPAALKALENNKDIIAAFVDILMPDMDGFELICRIRENKEYENVMLIMVTTETEMEQVEKALKFGANEYIMKPVMKDVIQSKLAILRLL